MKLTKILALVLATALLLVGCGDKREDIAGKIDNAPAAAAEPAATEAPLALGSMEGGTYTNPYAGFGCTLGSDWMFYGAEELQELPNSVAEMLEGTDIAEEMADYEQITDMMAENMEQLCNMNLLYQKVSVQDRLVFLSMGEADFIDAMLEEQGDVLLSSYAQMGIDITTMERVTVDFLGEKRSAIYMEGTNQGIPVYFTQIFDYSRGSYSITLTFTSFLEDNSEMMLDLFFPVE